MLPTFGPVLGVAVPTHEVFVALGVLCGLVVVVVESRRRALWGDEMLVVLAAGLVGGAVGMRLAGLLRDLPLVLSGAAGDVFATGAKSVLGGLTGAYVGVHVGKRLARWRVRTGDVFAPAAALGMSVGRVGCLLTEPPGRPTGTSWGVVLTAEQVAAVPGCAACVPGVPSHPSFAYEIVFHLVAFVLLWRARRHRHPPGALFVHYVAAYAVFRFGVEFVRGNEVVALGLTRGQLYLLPFLPLLAWRSAVLGRLSRTPAAPVAAPGTVPGDQAPTAPPLRTPPPCTPPTPAPPT